MLAMLTVASRVLFQCLLCIRWQATDIPPSTPKTNLEHRGRQRHTERNVSSLPAGLNSVLDFCLFLRCNWLMFLTHLICTQRWKTTPNVCMCVCACAWMHAGVHGADLNVSQQSLLISAEAVAEALSRQGCILRREGLPFERQGSFINSTNLWPASSCHTHTHTCVCPGGWEHYNAILQGEKKRESFSDECSKDSNPVKGDTQPNTEEHLYGVGWTRGVVMTW